MKKLIVVLLSIAVLFAFTACAKEAEPVENEIADIAENTEPEIETYEEKTEKKSIAADIAVSEITADDVEEKPVAESVNEEVPEANVTEEEPAASTEETEETVYEKAEKEPSAPVFEEKIETETANPDAEFTYTNEEVAEMTKDWVDPDTLEDAITGGIVSDDYWEYDESQAQEIPVFPGMYDIVEE